MEKNVETIQYQTNGTCCKIILLKILDDKILDSEFLGGCPGNTKGIKALIKGMDISEVTEKLKGIDCGEKGTSCPDQLAKCLIEYKNQKKAEVKN